MLVIIIEEVKVVFVDFVFYVEGEVGGVIKFSIICDGDIVEVIRVWY